ncbi:MAG: glycosyltransferase [Bacteroidia bacterium]
MYRSDSVDKYKVVLVGSLPIDLNTTGGVESVCLNLLSGFSTLEKVQVDFISFLKDINEIITVEYSANITIHYLPIRYPRFEIVDYLFNNRILVELLQRIKPKVIHIQGAVPTLLRFLFMSKRNIIVTQHGIMRAEIKHNVGIKNKLKFAFKTLIEKHYFPSFKNLIFISKYNFSLFPITEKYKYVLINNPVNPIFFNSDDEYMTTNPLQLVYIGWISKLKNILLLLNAIYFLKLKGIEYSLVVIGEFKEIEYKQKVIQFINEHGLNDQITFKGHLSQCRIKVELSQCGIMVLPSLQENTPVSIAEAMAMGKVVIASNVGGVSEMFEDKVSGFLIEKNNIESLSEKLELLYSNPHLLSEVSKQARLGAEKYRPKLVAEQTLRFYKSI